MSRRLVAQVNRPAATGARATRSVPPRFRHAPVGQCGSLRGIAGGWSALHQQSVRGRSSWHPHAHYSLLEDVQSDATHSRRASPSRQAWSVNSAPPKRKTPPGKAGFSKDSWGDRGDLGSRPSSFSRTSFWRGSIGFGTVGLAETALDRLRSSQSMLEAASLFRQHARLNCWVPSQGTLASPAKSGGRAGREPVQLLQGRDQNSAGR